VKILVIGESCRDVFVYGKVDRLEPAAPVPIVQTIETKSSGGMAMNVKNNFASFGVDVNIFTNTNWKSITKTRLVEKKTNHMFLRWDENDTSYGRIDLSAIKFSLYDAVAISDYNKGFLSKQDISAICKLHHLVFLDTKKPLGRWAENAAFIKINNHELSNAEKVTDKIRQKLIVTLGPEGASYWGKIFPVPAAETKDLSGAGDTFLAALCTHYCRNKDIEEAIKFANECATKVVQKRGVATVGEPT